MAAWVLWLSDVALFSSRREARQRLEAATCSGKGLDRGEGGQVLGRFAEAKRAGFAAGG